MTPAMALPTIPQTRIRWTGEDVPRVLPSIGETVGLLVTHDWGPLGSELDRPEILTSLDEWYERYGDSDTGGRTAVLEAFLGQNVPGGGGAGGLMPFRMAGSAAARASARIQNTAGTPRDAVTITAKWAGTRGNRFTWTIDADPADRTRDRFTLRYNGVAVESYTYTRADIANLVAQINTVDLGNISATLLIDGTSLGARSAIALTGGNDGDTLVAGDYLDALGGLEFQGFTVLAAQNLIDPDVQESVLSWVQAQDEANRPVMWVVGGDADDTLADALTRTVDLADPHVVNVGVGVYHDDVVGDDLSTAQLAPRFAGILAALGERAALTGAELGGLHVVGGSGVTTDEAEVAVRRGVTVMIRTDSPDADLRVARGLTTFTSTADLSHPVRIFSEPRFIRIMDLFTRRMKLWGDRRAIGKLPVNQDTRDAVKQEAGILIDALVRDGLILTRAGGAEQDPFVVVPVTTDDTIPFRFGWQFAYTTNFLIGDGRVR